MTDSSLCHRRHRARPDRPVAARTQLRPPPGRQYAGSLWPRSRPVPVISCPCHTGGPVTLATLKELRGADIRAFMAQRRNESLGSRSLARVLSALKSFFRFLEREGIVATEALNVIRTPKLPKSLPKALTVIEARTHHRYHCRNGRAPLGRRPRYGSAFIMLRRRPAHRRSPCHHPRRSRRPFAARHRQGRQDPPGAADRRRPRLDRDLSRPLPVQARGPGSHCSAASRAACCRRA